MKAFKTDNFLSTHAQDWKHMVKDLQ